MNQFILDKLAAGETIEGHKERGNSMVPLIKSRQPFTLAPVDIEKLSVGDIVLAKVKGRWYTHLIHALRDDAVLIGNNRGHMNGWAKKTNVVGIVTHVEGMPRRAALNKRKENK